MSALVISRLIFRLPPWLGSIGKSPFSPSKVTFFIRSEFNKNHEKYHYLLIAPLKTLIFLYVRRLVNLPNGDFLCDTLEWLVYQSGEDILPKGDLGGI